MHLFDQVLTRIVIQTNSRHTLPLTWNQTPLSLCLSPIQALSSCSWGGTLLRVRGLERNQKEYRNPLCGYQQKDGPPISASLLFPEAASGRRRQVRASETRGGGPRLGRHLVSAAHGDGHLSAGLGGGALPFPRRSPLILGLQTARF